MAEEEKIVVPADKPEISKKVKVDLEAVSYTHLTLPTTSSV